MKSVYITTTQYIFDLDGFFNNSISDQECDRIEILSAPYREQGLEIKEVFLESRMDDYCIYETYEVIAKRPTLHLNREVQS
jgi:hypothetical protein